MTDKTKTVLVSFEQILVPCVIVAEKTPEQAYGHRRYKVQPVGGKGAQWVNEERVSK